MVIATMSCSEWVTPSGKAPIMFLGTVGTPTPSATAWLEHEPHEDGTGQQAAQEDQRLHRRLLSPAYPDDAGRSIAVPTLGIVSRLRAWHAGLGIPHAAG